MVKSILWRLLGVAVLAAITYVFTRSLIQTSAITFLHHFVFIFVYYFHERLWLRSSWSERRKRWLKPITYEIVLGNGILALISYAVTGSLQQMTLITLVYIQNKLWIYCVYEWLWRRVKWGAFNPSEGYALQVETTSFCNQPCLYCPQSKYRLKNRVMPMEQYRKIIDSVRDLKIPITFIDLGGMGEALTEPQWFERFQYARKITGRFEVYTNGRVVTEQLLKQANRIVTRFYFSFHGNTPSEYMRLSGNDYDVMKRKLLLARKILGDKLFLLNYPEGKLGATLGVPVSSVHPWHNWGDPDIERLMKDADGYVDMAGCRHCGLTKYIIVRVDGSFGTCLNDWNHENDILGWSFPKCERCYNRGEYLKLRDDGSLKSFAGLLGKLNDRIGVCG